MPSNKQHFGGDVESIRRTPGLNQKALHTAIITHLYRKGAFRSAAKLAEVRQASDARPGLPGERAGAAVEREGKVVVWSRKGGGARRWVSIGGGIVAPLHHHDGKTGGTRARVRVR